MPRKLGNRVKVAVVGTPGSGDIILGAAVTDASAGDYQTFSGAGFLHLDPVRYFVIDGHAWGHEQGEYREDTSTAYITLREHLSSSTGSLLSLTSAAIVFVDVGNLDFKEIASNILALNGMGQL